MLIFAILGVNFFKGTYYYCRIEDHELFSQVSDIDSCKELGGVWTIIPSNFDNVLIASVTLFEMMTTEGWVDTMNNGIDTAGIEKQPIVENRPYAAIYFVIFIILGCFLVINLFTAVITDNFNKIKEEHEMGAGEANNDTQKQWIEIQNYTLKVMPARQPKPPSSEIRIKFFKLVNNPIFDIVIIVIIVFNTLVIAMTHLGMSKEFESTILVFNYIFVFFYNVEMALKLIGLGLQYFTHDGWNRFDFL